MEETLETTNTAMKYYTCRLGICHKHKITSNYNSFDKNVARNLVVDAKCSP